MRVMIVDDAMFMRLTLKKIVESEGFEVIAEASNGAEAVTLYKTEKPDLVLMDITMPDMDGIEALKQIHEYDNNAEVIMISALGQQNKIVQAIESGAKNFIVKPFEERKIREVLSQYK